MELFASRQRLTGVESAFTRSVPGKETGDIMRKFGILLAFVLAMLAVLPAAAQSPEVALTL